jgi:mono/diheme cytochrome c family protein
MTPACAKRLARLLAVFAWVGLGALPAMAAAPAAPTAAPTVAPLLAPEVLFARRCGLCHNAGGVGAQILARRLGPERSVLATRGDLTVPFVTVAVRRGLLNMPRLTRVEVTDEELVAIATWLARPREEQNL